MFLLSNMTQLSHCPLSQLKRQMAINYQVYLKDAVISKQKSLFLLMVICKLNISFQFKILIVFFSHLQDWGTLRLASPMEGKNLTAKNLKNTQNKVKRRQIIY